MTPESLDNSGFRAGDAPPPSLSPIRVIVVDDHPIVRLGVVSLLDADERIQVVGQASQGIEAVQLAGELEPDVVVMDIRMPGGDGVEATRSIVAQGLPTSVLMLTTYETDEAIVSAIAAGAKGYVLKGAPEEDIVAAVVAVAHGQSVLGPDVAAALARQAGPAAGPTSAIPSLSAREHDVLLLIGAGCSNTEIGERLFIGIATVKTHIEHIFAKLDVTDRTRAVTRAQELGIW